MSKVFVQWAIGLLASFSITSALQAAAEPETVGVDTPDGLRLAGTWYRGDGGKDSDCVLLLHNYGAKYSSNTPEWENLALALQKEGFSVLKFDLRGHGNARNNPKTVNVPKDFAMWKFNEKAGVGRLHPDNPPKSLVLNVDKFQPSYYPYLINDIAAGRYFLDKRNDQGQCNSGRINVICDRQICPLAMYWLAIEFTRNGKYKQNINDFAAPKHDAGTDIMSMICLSYQEHGTLPWTFINKQANGDMMAGIKNKVSVLLVDNEKADKAGGVGGSNEWFKRWGILGKKSDTDIRKYVMAVPKSESLSGIDLLSAKKQLGVETEIIEFLKKSKTPAKGKVALNGNDWTTRNTGIETLMPVPLEDYGIK
jgi:hypothetical protein